MQLTLKKTRPNISPMMAEQLTAKPMHVEALSTGERVIIDPALTTQRMFMYFYLFINIGSIIGQITMVYAERYVGFWLSFTLPTIMFMLCPLVMIAFHKQYRQRPPTGSVLAKSAQLIKFALKGKTSINPVRTIANIRDPAFWEDVKPSRVENRPKWMTFDDAWVDEVARGTKACLVFGFYPLFWLAYNQIDNNLVSQANTMTLNGVPNDLLNNLNPLGIIIMIPILDNIIYPVLRKLKIRFTPLRRMCAGFFVACAGMIWATVVQYYIYHTGECGYYMNTCDNPAPLNVWIQSGSYILIGLAEIFSSITGLEYAYTKAPAIMKSLVFGRSPVTDLRDDHSLTFPRFLPLHFRRLRRARPGPRLAGRRPAADLELRCCGHHRLLRRPALLLVLHAPVGQPGGGHEPAQGVRVQGRQPRRQVRGGEDCGRRRRAQERAAKDHPCVKLLVRRCSSGGIARKGVDPHEFNTTVRLAPHQFFN
jgi:hypothetical protein